VIKGSPTLPIRIAVTIFSVITVITVITVVSVFTVISIISIISIFWRPFWNNLAYDMKHSVGGIQICFEKRSTIKCGTGVGDINGQTTTDRPNHCTVRQVSRRDLSVGNMAK
jgi:hypothetical protein